MNYIMKGAAWGLIIGLALGGYLLSASSNGNAIAAQTTQVERLHQLTYYYDPATGCYYVSNDSSHAGITPRMESQGSASTHSKHMCRPPK